MDRDDGKRYGYSNKNESVTTEKRASELDGKLRNMTSIYISKQDKMLLLYRQGGRVVNDIWVGSAGGHFEANELNDAKACVLPNKVSLHSLIS